MSKIQDHPVMATLTIMGTLFGLAASLAAFGQFAPELAYGAGGLLVLAVIGALIYSEWNWEPEPITAPVPEQEPAPLLTVMGTTYTVERYFTLPPHHLAQRYYLEAFQALADGGYQQTINGEAHNWPLGVEVGKIAMNWINDHYREYTYRYPGARGEQTKQQIAELAFQRIHEGRLFASEIATIIVPLVNRHVSDRFAQEH